LSFFTWAKIALSAKILCCGRELPENQLISKRQIPYHPLPCHAKLSRACAALQSKAKNFIGCPSLSREEAGGSGPLRTRMTPRDPISAVQDEISRLTLYHLEEEARRYVYGEVRMRTKSKPTNIH
jgi:hypothetical protein